MANLLQTYLNEIKSQKDTYLLPENLKEGVTLLGVTGTLESGGTGSKLSTTGAYLCTAMSSSIENPLISQLDDLSDYYDLSALTSLYYAFYYSQATGYDFSNWDLSQVTNWGGTFGYNTKLTEISLPEATYYPTNLAQTFIGCSSLTSIDMSMFDTSNCTSMYRLFYDCSSLTEIIGIEDLDISKVVDFSGAFYISSSSLTTITMNGSLNSCSDLSSNFISNSFYVKNGVFPNLCTSTCTSLSSLAKSNTRLISLDFSNWDVSSVTNMNMSFYGCTNLTTLNLSNWIFPDVDPSTDCSELSWSYEFAEYTDTYGVDMGYMFYNCSSLTSLDLSNWSCSNAVNFYDMFYCCSSLTKLDLSGLTDEMFGVYSYSHNESWNPEYSLYNDMFYGCTSLQTLDISGLGFAGTVETYSTTMSWSVDGSDLKYGNFFGSGSYACSKLTTVYVKDEHAKEVVDYLLNYAGLSITSTIKE